MYKARLAVNNDVPAHEQSLCFKFSVLHRPKKQRLVFITLSMHGIALNLITTLKPVRAPEQQVKFGNPLVAPEQHVTFNNLSVAQKR